MPASKSSKRSLISSGVAFVLMAALGSAAAAWFYFHGYTLYYGDAEAHLNTARRIVDSRTPGYDQLGTPWLPLPHLLMIPFVMNDALWRSGLRYRICMKTPGGRPDIVFPRRRLAVFVDGCQWHKYPKHYLTPRTQIEF